MSPTALYPPNGGAAVGPAMRRARWLAVMELMLVQAAALVLLGLTTPVPSLVERHPDVGLYHELASAVVVGGAIPYVDLSVEYPPFALGAIIGPQVIPPWTGVDLQAYAWRFLAMNALFASAIALLLVTVSRSPALRRQPAAQLTAYLPFAVVLSPLIAWRLDVLPALLSLAAFALVLASRPIAAGLTLAASIMTKLYALPLVVLFAAWHLAHRQFREAAVLIGTVAVVCLPALALFALPGVTPSFLWFQLGRGIQVESLYAGIIGLTSLGGLEVGIEYDFGAHQVISPWSAGMARIAQLAALVAVGSVLVLAMLRFRRRASTLPPTGTELAAYTAAILLALILTSKVLSPQYLVWLIPFVPFLPVGPRLLLLVAALLTVVIFPYLYYDLLRADSVALIVLNLRNGLLLAALVWLVIRFRPIRFRPSVDVREGAVES